MLQLCQLLMENDVFEPVKATHHHHPDDAKNRFEDSSTKFYRFVEDATKENKYTTEQVKFACTPCTKMRSASLSSHFAPRLFHSLIITTNYLCPWNWRDFDH